MTQFMLGLDGLKGMHKLMLEDALKNVRTSDDEKKVRMAQLLEERSAERACFEYVVDVQSALKDNEAALRGNDCKTMKQFLDALQRKCRADQTRRQQRFLAALMKTVLLPFYQITRRVREIGNLTDDTRQFMAKKVCCRRAWLQMRSVGCMLMCLAGCVAGAEAQGATDGRH